MIQPAKDDIVRALEACAGELAEVACTCVDRSDGHQSACQGVASAKPYYDLVDRVRKPSSWTKEDAAAVDLYKHASRELPEVQAFLRDKFPNGGRWIVVRRGRPSARVRAIYVGKMETAEKAFERVRARMRQGMLALIDPSGIIAKYASEPMVRTRW